MMRKRLVILVAGLCLAAGLCLVLAGQLRQSGPYLASAPIGNGGGLGARLPVDQRAGRAYLLDDGVIDQEVTLAPGGGYTWPPYAAINTTVRVLDTRTGRIVMAIPVSDSTDDLAVDAYTGRLFTVNYADGQVQVYDARGGRLLNTRPWDGNASINTVLVGPRTGHLLLTTSVPLRPAAQRVLMLDGYTGRVLRSVVFPHGPRVVEKQLYGNGSSFSYYLPSLAMALDARAGRLYAFNRGQTMSVLDSASGHLLYIRRLPVPIAGAQVDDSTGRIFAFDASRNPAVMGGTIIDGRHTPLHLVLQR